MVSPDVARRHRALMAEMVTRWRRRAELAPQEPSVPYDDELDESPEHREQVVAEVLGRLIGRLGKVDLSSYASPADVDRMFARIVRDDVASDTRPGALEAARVVLSLLGITEPMPHPDSPALGESPS